MSTKKCVVCFSGGLDSTVCLHKARADGFEVYPLSVDYGQRHKRELFVGRLHLMDHFGTETITRWQKLPMEFLARSIMTGSSQTGHVEVPEGHYEEETMKATVVPNRNMVLLALATSYAVSLRADVVMYAAHAGDHAIYPDCRFDFVQSMAVAIGHCDWYPPQLVTPFINVPKSDIVRRGHKLGVDFKQTYSCYKGGEKHCGKCGTCNERKEAFQLAGVPDPTEYK